MRIIEVLNEALIGLLYKLSRSVDQAVDTYLLFEYRKYQFALVLRQGSRGIYHQLTYA